MRVPGLSWSLLCGLLFDACRAHRVLPEHEQRLFRARSDSDWAVVWHQESHVRCRENIARHLYWACEKDIYKISKRSPPFQELRTWPMVSKDTARSLLRVRRRRAAGVAGSITEECCSASGCTWEEYAEYCPDHRRVRRMYPSQ